jgi:hypothetical protein
MDAVRHNNSADDTAKPRRHIAVTQRSKKLGIRILEENQTKGCLNHQRDADIRKQAGRTQLYGLSPVRAM